jgi:hypothetical protein
MVTVYPIFSLKELREFARFKTNLYKNHPYAVPQLRADEVNALCKGKNPALDVYEHQVFLAKRDGKTVGRIVGIINHKDNENEGKKRVRFGYIDFIDDAAVAAALIEAVEKWGAARGMTEIHGPLGFTDLDPEGMLVEGFDQLGTIATIYNYSYYPQHLERLGFHKVVDWIERKLFAVESIPEKHLKAARLVQERYGLKTLPQMSIRRLQKEGYVKKVFQLLNLCYAHLYGFTQVNEDMIDYYIKNYLPVLRPDLISIVVNKEGAVVGFGVAIPSLAKAMQKAGGRLFPFGIFHLLRAVKGRLQVCDLALIAVHPEYRNLGTVALIFNHLIPRFQKMGTEYAECYPVLESNNNLQTLWKEFRNEPHKRRRIYEKKIG